MGGEAGRRPGRRWFTGWQRVVPTKSLLSGTAACGLYLLYQGAGVMTEEGSGGFFAVSAPVAQRRLREIDRVVEGRGEARQCMCSHRTSVATGLAHHGNDYFAGQLARAVLHAEPEAPLTEGAEHGRWAVVKVDPHRLTGSAVILRHTLFPGRYRIAHALRSSNDYVDVFLTEVFTDASRHSASLWLVAGVPRRAANKYALGTALPRMQLGKELQEGWAAWAWRSLQESIPGSPLRMEQEMERIKRQRERARAERE